MGWGLFTNALFWRHRKVNYLSSLILLGIFSLTLLIKLIHFVYPINWIVSSFLSLAGLSGILFYGKERINKAIHSSLLFFCAHKWQFFIIYCILIYWCLRILHPSTNYDTAAYHIQTIRWINEFQSIPGLGNLSPYFALNQSYFELLAFLRFFPFLLNGFAIGGLLFFVILGLIFIERRKFKYVNYSIFAFLLYLLTHPQGSHLFSPTPDFILAA